MPPTTDYEILVAPTIEELETKVKAAVATGWIVSGNIGFAGHQLPFRRNAHFYQAMVKTPDLINQINNKLATISSTLSTISTNTNAIKNSVASIDAKTPDN